MKRQDFVAGYELEYNKTNNKIQGVKKSVNEPDKLQISNKKSQLNSRIQNSKMMSHESHINLNIFACSCKIFCQFSKGQGLFQCKIVETIGAQNNFAQMSNKFLISRN